MTNERKLTIEDVVVPQFMLDAAEQAYSNRGRMRDIIAAALLALVEKPIVPTDGQSRDMAMNYLDLQDREKARFAAVEWQRRMFLAPTPALPESVKALHVTGKVGTGIARLADAMEIDKLIDAAYVIGLKEPK